MPIDVDLEPLFADTITIERRTCSHTDGYVSAGYGPAVEYQAKIERSAELDRNDEGREIVSRRKVFLYISSAWTAANVPRVVDRLTLPETHAPTQPQIRLVQPVSDENGIHHIVLWC